MRPVSLCFVLTLALTTSVAAQAEDTVSAEGVDPGSSLQGLHHATAALRTKAFKTLGRLQRYTVLVRFQRTLSQDEVRTLDADDLTFGRREGKLLNIGRLYEMTATRPGLARLDAHPLLLDIDVALPDRVLLPERENEWGRVPELLGTDRLWPLTNDEGVYARGEGVVLADLDVGIDLYHPMLFRPDGGYYAWIDTDGDGVFSPSIDAVDLDGDGEAGEGETLLVLGGNVYAIGNTLINAAMPFDPARSWLFTDSDFSDRSRNVGPQFGYDDDTPGFGEPLFLVDDVDQDGLLDPEEKLIRLGTSKVRAIYQVISGGAWHRGENLTDYPVYQDLGHGSSVSGLLVGGVPGRNFVVGAAPDAEVIMLDGNVPEGVSLDDIDYGAGQLAALQFARDQGAHLVLHEYGQRVGEYADGSSAHEELIDELSAAGVVQATATHNFANNGGDCYLSLAPGETEEVEFEVFDGFGIQAYSIAMNYRWPNATSLDVQATVYPPGDGVPGELIDTAFGPDIYSLSIKGISARDTGMFNSQIFQLNEGGDQITDLPTGTWRIAFTNTSSGTIAGPLKITDESSYSSAVFITSHIPTDIGTMAWPSTADSAISVGASVGNAPTPEAGEEDLSIRYFSGRGPRIDGLLAIDIVAPSDHYTMAAEGEVPAASYVRFGGTSGALPQVAGGIALLLQQEPDLTSEEIRERLHSSASGEGTGSLPNNNWGYGRLNIFRLLMGEDPAENTSPLVDAIAETPLRGLPVALDVTGTTDAEDPLDTLIFRVDVGYDGIWNAQATGAAPEIVLEDLGPATLVIEAIDPYGASSSRVLTLDVMPAPEEPQPVGCGCDADGQPQSGALVGVGVGLLALSVRRRRRTLARSPGRA